MNANVKMHGKNGAWVFAQNTTLAGRVARDQQDDESSDCFWLDLETARNWASPYQVQHNHLPYALFYWRAGRNVMEFCGIQIEGDDA